MSWDKHLTQAKIDKIDELQQIIVEFIRTINEKGIGVELTGKVFRGVKWPAHGYRDPFCRISSLKYLRKTLFHFNLAQLSVLTARDVWEIWDRGYRGCAQYLIKNGDKEEKAKGHMAIAEAH